MAPDLLQALKLLQKSSHILWDEYDTPIRHLLCDLRLYHYADLGFKDGKPYVFKINAEGLRILQASEMGDV